MKPMLLTSAPWQRSLNATHVSAARSPSESLSWHYSRSSLLQLSSPCAEWRAWKASREGPGIHTMELRTRPFLLRALLAMKPMLLTSAPLKPDSDRHAFEVKGADALLIS